MMRFYNFPPKDPGSEVRATFDGQHFHVAKIEDGALSGSYHSESLPVLLDQVMEIIDLHRGDEVMEVVRILQREAMQARLDEIMATSGRVRPQTLELLRTIAA